MTPLVFGLVSYKPRFHDAIHAAIRHNFSGKVKIDFLHIRRAKHEAALFSSVVLPR